MVRRASGLGSYLTQSKTQSHPYLLLLAGGGVGEAALHIERMGLGVAGLCHTGSIYHNMQSLGIHILHIT